jgi:hypothetical protein
MREFVAKFTESQARGLLMMSCENKLTGRGEKRGGRSDAVVTHRSYDAQCDETQQETTWK